MGPVLASIALASNLAVKAGDTDSVRLIPFPEEVQIKPGSLSLKRPLVREVNQDQARTIGDQIGAPAPS